ncbi:MAG: hypothetical protein GY870_09760 [archaeon]|nr:hypothetical protein [archaeon]
MSTIGNYFIKIMKKIEQIESLITSIEKSVKYEGSIEDNNENFSIYKEENIFQLEYQESIKSKDSDIIKDPYDKDWESIEDKKNKTGKSSLGWSSFPDLKPNKQINNQNKSEISKQSEIESKSNKEDLISDILNSQKHADIQVDHQRGSKIRTEIKKKQKDLKIKEEHRQVENLAENIIQSHRNIDFDTSVKVAETKPKKSSLASEISARREALKRARKKAEEKANNNYGY